MGVALVDIVGVALIDIVGVALIDIVGVELIDRVGVALVDIVGVALVDIVGVISDIIVGVISGVITGVIFVVILVIAVDIFIIVLSSLFVVFSKGSIFGVCAGFVKEVEVSGSLDIDILDDSIDVASDNCAFCVELPSEDMLSIVELSNGSNFVAFSARAFSVIIFVATARVD